MLKVLKLSQEVVDVYRDELSNESLTGVITDFSDDFLYLSLFTESGAANGISIVFRHDITRMRWSGNERQAIAELIEAAGSKATKPRIELESIQSVLKSVSDTFGYVNALIERIDDSITFIGEIAELDEESLVLDTYGTFSTRDRSKLLLRCQDLTRVDADASYERSVALLARKIR
ncbi:hypothetical protein GCM10011521_19960 [Arenimonas soli]|uniref:Uncharacterized protein n=2 Tax=Arenimonas soli TaxID=2269504 RepID=A0ABQ1HM22_9GAMM|nr:hypothetical protein GCM10011521_19960 [Arenimonas soli]